MMDKIRIHRGLYFEKCGGSWRLVNERLMDSFIINNEILTETLEKISKYNMSKPQYMELLMLRLMKEVNNNE